MDRYTAITRRIRTEFPAFQVRRRSDTWLRYPFAILAKVTRVSYQNFVMTLGATVYVGDNWDAKTANGKYRTLRHELVHIRQFHRWPLGPKFSWLNRILMPLCYLLVLPAIWTFRSKLEREGYTQSLLVDYELGGPIAEADMEVNAKKMVKYFAGSAYFWMSTKKKAYAWAMQTQRAINRGEISNKLDRIDSALEEAVP